MVGTDAIGGGASTGGGLLIGEELATNEGIVVLDSLEGDAVMSVPSDGSGEADARGVVGSAVFVGRFGMIVGEKVGWSLENAGDKSALGAEIG